MSARSGVHPSGPSDPYDTMRMVREFHLTRLEWCYPADRYAEEAKQLGVAVGGALNDILADADGGRSTGRVTGKDGQLVRHAWQAPGTWAGCANAPEYRDAWFHHAKRLVDAGVDFIQQDDPHMCTTCMSLCYCKYCAAAFDRYKLEHGEGADYLEFQKASILAFHREVRARLNAYAGRHVPFSHNDIVGFTGALDWTSSAFDFVTAEIDPGRYTRPEALYKMAAAARAAGQALVFQLRDTSVPNNHRVLAAMYATGSVMMLPFDVYMGNAPRYFGRTEEYAAVAGFIRGVAPYLDGYEEAAAVGPGILEPRYGDASPVAIEAGGGETYAFVRAKPGNPSAPVVVHIVDWSAESKPLALRLLHTCLFGTRRVRARLLTPAPYRAEAHRRAQVKGAYGSLVVQAPLTVSAEGEFAVVQVPPARPWSILVLSPAR